MAIQMRRGQSVDFDPTKMLTGEWAVSIDNESQKQMVYMCFAPGVVKRMATLEDFQNELGKVATFGITDDGYAIVNLFNLSENLKNCIDVERDYILQRIQIKVNAMSDIYFEELNGKTGLIRGEMLGGSLNNWVSINTFNCWELLMGQSAAKTLI